tara:strand:+ start:1178 stop:1744 length:567 start_codon:yes stop_codon:yes gene_type:complete
MFKKVIDKEISSLKNLLNKLEFSDFNNLNLLFKYSIKAIKQNKKIIFFGNGGSAADSQHLATELTVRFRKKRKAIPAIALTTDGSALTAIGNDFNFNEIFSRQIEAIGNKGDVCISLTTSGNSKNLINAIKVAKKKKLLTFCFSGNNGGKIKKVCEYSIIIPSKNADKIQVIELFLGQVLCGLIEDSL